MLLAGLLVGFFLAAAGAWGLGFWMRRWATARGWLDIPDEGRHRHARPVPFGGGLVAWFVCALAVGLVSWFWPELFRSITPLERFGFFLSTLPLLVVGTIDDRRPLRPSWLLLGVLLSVVIALVFGLRVERLSLPSGMPLPLSSLASLGISTLWLLACTGATKFSDGLDGLVAGQTVIGALLITGLCLSTRFYQPEVALLAVLFGGSFLGVFLHGWPKARLFLGEFGSTFAGFGLGILALISGAKFAIALMAVGFFAADIIWVMLRRLWRGTSPLQGDRTHLHFVLLAAGLPSWAVTLLLWGLALGFGLAALQMQTQAKMLLLAVVVLLTWTLSYIGTSIAERRGARLV